MFFLVLWFFFKAGTEGPEETKKGIFGSPEPELLETGILCQSLNLQFAQEWQLLFEHSCSVGSSNLFFLRALCLTSFAPIQVFSFATETENWLSEKWENFNTDPAGQTGEQLGPAQRVLQTGIVSQAFWSSWEPETCSQAFVCMGLKLRFPKTIVNCTTMYGKPNIRTLPFAPIFIFFTI